MIFKILKIKSAEKFFLFFFNYSLNINTWSLYFTLHKSEVYSDHITWIIVICDWKKNVAVERAIIEKKKAENWKKILTCRQVDSTQHDNGDQCKSAHVAQ